MSEFTDAHNAAILDFAEKLLRLVNIQVDAALKQTDIMLKSQQMRFAPWQMVSGGAAAGAALLGAAIALVHWL